MSSSSSASKKIRRGKAARSLRAGPSLANIEEKKGLFNSTGDPSTFRLPIPPPIKSYDTVTTYLLTAGLVSSAATEVDSALVFGLNLMNAAELAGYQAIFDQYRIRAVEAIIVPRSTGLNASVSAVPGTLVSAVDYDSNANTTVANLITYNNSLTSSGFVAHYHAFTPCVSVAAGASNSASSATSMVVRSPWLDLAVTTTPHYGLKFSITQTDVVYTSDIHVRLHLSFRGKT